MIDTMYTSYPFLQSNRVFLVYKNIAVIDENSCLQEALNSKYHLSKAQFKIFFKKAIDGLQQDIYKIPNNIYYWNRLIYSKRFNQGIFVSYRKNCFTPENFNYTCFITHLLPREKRCTQNTQIQLKQNLEISNCEYSQELISYITTILSRKYVLKEAPRNSLLHLLNNDYDEDVVTINNNKFSINTYILEIQ